MYIIQNPIGEVFYVDKLTTLGEEEFKEGVKKPEEPVSEVEGMRGYKLPVDSTYSASSQNSSRPECGPDKVGNGLVAGSCNTWTAGGTSVHIDITFPTPQVLNGMDVFVGGYASTGTGFLRVQNYVNDSWATVYEGNFTSVKGIGALVSIDFAEKTTFEKIRIYQKSNNGSWIGISEVTIVK